MPDPGHAGRAADDEHLPGASHELTPAALDPDLIRSASMTFLEGYLWGPERPRAAMLEAARIAQAADRTVAFTLSESLCLGDRREGVLGMIEADWSISCSAMSMRCGTSSVAAISTTALRPFRQGRDTGDHARRARRDRRRAKASGSRSAAAPVAHVVDTTGAGDQFAAGFLAARLRGRALEGVPRSRRDRGGGSHLALRRAAGSRSQAIGGPVKNLDQLAVYCGSAPGSDPAFADAARATAAAMVRESVQLVYGGGRLGLMGLIADSVLELRRRTSTG